MNKSTSRWLAAAAVALAIVQVSCGPKEVKWSLDYKQEMKQVAAEKSMALILVDGPGWNKPSDNLRKNLLQSKDFAQFVQSNKLHTVEAIVSDPSKRGVTPAVADILQSFFQNYSVQGLPTLVLTDETGYAFCTVEGDDAEKVMRVLRDGVRLRNLFVTKLKEARDAQGEQRGILLMQARELLPEKTRDAYPGLNEEILTNDSRDVTGLHKILARRDLHKSQLKLVNTKVAEHVGDATKLKPQEVATRLREVIKKLLEDDQWLPEVRQYMCEVLMTSYLYEQNMPEVLHWGKEAVAAAPDSDRAAALKTSIERIQEELAKKAPTEVPAPPPTTESP